MPPKQREIVVEIKDEEHIQQYLNSDNTKLIILDIFPKWAGPCTLMAPIYKEWSNTIEDFEKRIVILNVELEKIENYKNEKLTREQSSKPRFIFYYQGKFVDEVHGADSPSLFDKIHKYIPMVY